MEGPDEDDLGRCMADIADDAKCVDFAIEEVNVIHCKYDCICCKTWSLVDVHNHRLRQSLARSIIWIGYSPVVMN